MTDDPLKFERGKDSILADNPFVKDNPIASVPEVKEKEVKAEEIPDELEVVMELKDSQSTQEQKIKDILKNRGMDSQQRIQAFDEIKAVLGW